MDLVFAPSQVESWPIARLRPYARNAKMHGDDQVAKIAASMAKFGWTVPCMVADDGELIAGHGRVLAATLLGLTEVPVIRLSHLDEAERRAYRIADNKLTELGEWDEALLREEIAGLLAEDFDLSLLGITDEDLDALLRDPDQLEGGAVEGSPAGVARGALLRLPSVKRRRARPPSWGAEVRWYRGFREPGADVVGDGRFSMHGNVRGLNGIRPYASERRETFRRLATCSTCAA